MLSIIALLITLLTVDTASKTLRSCIEEHRSSAGIVLKGDSNYTALNFQSNIRKLKYPRGYIVVKTAEDVKIALKCLIEQSLSFTMKSGGHSFEKYSFANSDAFVIDLSHLNTVNFNHETEVAIVGAGLQAFDVMKRLWEFGNYGLPLGSCPTVGISGFTLGGGFGSMSRKVGLMSDNVVEMEVVTADQKIIRVNKNHHSDLYWALRGGGGGNFGFVTKFHLKTFNASVQFIKSTIKYKIEEFPAVFDKWQQWAKSNPKSSIDSVMYYKIFSPRNLVLNFHIYSLNFTESLEALRSIKVYFNEVDTGQNIKISSFFDSLYQNYRPSKPSLVYDKHKSFFISKYLNLSQINLFNHILMKHNYVSFLIQLCGGAVNAKSATETAFCHRSSLFELDYGFTIRAKNDTDIEQMIKKGEQLEPKLMKFAKSIQFMSDGESYVNVIDGDERNALLKYYCDNLDRLSDVKRRYDPSDVFKFPLSIPLK